MNHSKFSTCSLKPLRRSFLVDKISLSVLFICIFSIYIFAQPNPSWCSLSVNYTIPDNATVKISDLFPIPVTSGSISHKVFEIGINAVLEVDKTFLFNYCSFKCKKGARIKVVTSASNAPTRLYSFNSNYFSCSDIWGGVIVNPGNNITFRKSRIYDASKGIYFPPGYNSASNEITNDSFSNNLYGIYIGLKTAGGSANVGFTRCYGNLFNQPSNTLIDGVSQARAGVYVTQTSSLLWGTQGAPQNKFDGLPYGVILVGGSSGIIENSDFLNMKDLGNINGFDEKTDGTGIFVSGSSLTMIQPGSHRCQFVSNANAGVYCSFAKGPVKVNYCDFSGDQQYGIKYDDQFPGNYLWVEHNNFDLSLEHSIAAIEVMRPAATKSIPNSMLTDNIINIPNGTGNIPTKLKNIIYVKGVTAAENRFIINKNVIHNNSKSKKEHGIYLEGAGDNYEVSDNKIFYHAPISQLGSSQACLGIVFDNMGGSGNQISYNAIYSRLRSTTTSIEDDDKSFIKCGIHVVSCNAPTIKCNTIDSTYRGIHIAEFNPGTYLGGNTINHHAFGVDFRKNTNTGANTHIDNQIRTENKWLKDELVYNGAGARYWDAANPDFKFYYDPNLIASQPYSYTPPSASPYVSSWFLHEAGNPNNSCGLKPNPNRNFSDAEIAIAKGTYFTYSIVTNWDLQRRLWYNMTRYPELVAQNADIQAFSNASIGSSTQRFANAIYQYERAFLLDSITAFNLSTQYTQTDALLGDIMTIISTINQQDTMDVDDTTINALNSQWTQLCTVSQNINGIQEIFDLVKNSNLQNLQTVVNALPAAQQWESAWKSILSIGIKQGQSLALSAEDLNTLKNIASDCSANVGLARQTVLPFMPSEYAYSFLGSESDEPCILTSEGRYQNETADQTTLQVFPNPAKDVIWVNLSSATNAKWQIFDISGKIMTMGTFSKENQVFEIDLSGFSNGLYFLKYMETGQAEQNFKFSIVK